MLQKLKKNAPKLNVTDKMFHKKNSLKKGIKNDPLKQIEQRFLILEIMSLTVYSLLKLSITSSH